MTTARTPLSLGVLAHLHHPIVEPFAGGLEAHTAQICRELARRGHRVTLYAKEGSVVPDADVEVVAVMPADFVWGFPHTPGDTHRLDAAMTVACRRARHHDVVLNNSLSPLPYELTATPMLTALHTPAILDRVAAVVQRPTWYPPAGHRWISVSHANAVDWQRLLGVAHVGVIHNGVDLSRWPASFEPGEGFVWTGRITPEKGLHVAIDAARALGVPLRIAGPVSDPRYMAEEIEPRLAARGSTYLGHLAQTELARLLAGAAAFVCTPRWDEPFGLAPLEAMACGTPVAALARGALPEVLGEDGGVLATDPGELPQALVAATRADRRAVRARAERFSLAAMADAYEETLTSLGR